MAAITSAGIGSGLDIEGLVSQLVAAEGQPASLRLNKTETVLQADLSALGTLKSALSSFQSSVLGLKDLSVFQARNATSSNVELFTATANSAAVAGSFSIVVDQLAQSAKLRSVDFASENALLGAGSLTLGLGAVSFAVAVAADTTLAGLRDAINQASDNPGIKATIVNVDSGSQLVLTSDKVGSANAITVRATDTDALDGYDLTRLATANLTPIQPAQDAIIHVDGQTVTRGSNSFSDVITGVTLALKKADPAKTETVTVDLDKSAVTVKVDDFIKSYNSLISTMNNLSSYDPDSKQGGPLLGDPTLRGVKNQIRQVLSNPVQGLTGFTALSEIGITTNKSGVLELDASKLDKAMASDFESVSKIFASDGGVSVQLDGLLKNYLSVDGALSTRLDGVRNRIDNIGEQRDRLNIRLAAIEARFRKQFTAMDALLGQLQSTGNFLTQQLKNLPSASGNN